MEDDPLYCEKSDFLKDLHIGLCVTGSIAAVDAVRICRELRRHGASVRAIMSDSAMDIIHPNSLEFATGKDVITRITGKVEHVLYAGESPCKFDILVICPCTRNSLSKIAGGISDTPPTLFAATALSHIPILLFPAMHKTMHDSLDIMGVLSRLNDMGVTVYSEEANEGKIKVPGTGRIVHEIRKATSKRTLSGKRVLVSAGPTIEPIDDVRYITNKSTGKMGIALAEELEARGASVKLVLGKTPEESLVSNTVRKETFGEMREEVLDGEEYDIYVLSMAASDFTVKKHDGKISSNEGFSLDLSPNKKIISELRNKKNGFIVGFKAEHDISEDELIKRARESMSKSGADMVIANDVGKPMRGFAADTNEVYIVTGDDYVKKIPLSRKTAVANSIANRIEESLSQGL